MSKRTKHVAVSLAMAAALLAGWAGFAGAQQLVINGAGGMTPMAKELAQAYKAKNASSPFVMGAGGSTSDAGLRGVADGRIHIGLSSKDLGAAERAEGLQSIEIARAAVVFAVHPSVKVSSLTGQQVCDIYAGKITNWKDVGGPNLTIVPLTRPAQESDPQIIKKQLPCFKEAESVVTLPKAPDIPKALTSRPGGIGMTTMPFVEDSNGAIRALNFNGIAPTAENVEKESYPLIRRFLFITKGKPAGPVAEFVAFVKGPDGQQVIREAKAVPVK